MSVAGATGLPPLKPAASPPASPLLQSQQRNSQGLRLAPQRASATWTTSDDGDAESLCAADGAAAALAEPGGLPLPEAFFGLGYVAASYAKKEERLRQRRAAAALPDCEWARNETETVLIPGLLSAEEVAELHAAAARIAAQVGPLRFGRKCWEQRVAGSWELCYLHTGGAFEAQMPELSAKLRAAAEAADEHGVLARARKVNPDLQINWRTIEYHDRHATTSADEDRGLMDVGHVDSGSLLTLDVMLSSPGEEFAGGELVTLQQKEGEEEELRAPAFGKGDAVLFVSHKEHNVKPVTRGRRRVLVLELWQGDACSCPHRCCTRWGCQMAIAPEDALRAAISGQSPMSAADQERANVEEEAAEAAAEEAEEADEADEADEAEEAERQIRTRPHTRRHMELLEQLELLGEDN